MERNRDMPQFTSQKTSQRQSHRIQLYDNGGKTYDRYTAMFLDRPETKPDQFEALGFNEEPYAAQGFGQHCTAMPGKHLGKRIKLSDLPEAARKFVEENI